MGISKHANTLFSRPCVFIAGVQTSPNFPPSTLPEIAFIGRSNVGKSSLINAITRRKSLARVSRTPGRTQQINFFSIDERIILTDLPGYGYAKLSHQTTSILSNLVHDYFKKRSPLVRTMLLIDARHGLKPTDQDMMSFLDREGLSYQLVFTKCDAPKKTELDALLEHTRSLTSTHPAMLDHIISSSTRTKTGIDMLQEIIAEIALPDKHQRN